MSTTYKAIQVTKPGEFAVATKPLVDPGPGQVRIRVFEEYVWPFLKALALAFWALVIAAWPS